MSSERTAPPAFQFYAADWLSSTSIALMTAHEERAYLRLLCHAWADENCSLPDDRRRLMKLGLLRSEAQLEVVLRQFAPHPELPGRLINPRLFEIRQQSEDFRAERAAAGRAGGRKAQAQRREGVVQSSSSDSSSARSSASAPLQANGEANREAKSSSSSSSSGAPSEHRNTPPLASRETPHAGGIGSVEGSRPEELFAVEGLTPEELVQVYNARLGGLAPALETSPQRRARLRSFSRKRPRLTSAEWGAFVEALGRDPWACGTKPGGRDAAIGIDTLVRGDFFERQREMLFGRPRLASSRPRTNRPGRAFDRPAETWNDEPHGVEIPSGGEPP